MTNIAKIILAVMCLCAVSSAARNLFENENQTQLYNIDDPPYATIAVHNIGKIAMTVSNTGGHLAANLGTVELTIALHYVFNTPDDRLVWDVGHQSYLHKILTGRREQMHSLRQKGGLAGWGNG